MTYSFTGSLLKEGHRHFIKIPFDVWAECGQTGLVPVQVFLPDCSFECRLIPKGGGIYYIPIAKSVAEQLGSGHEISISFAVISGLTRINHDSPYTKENPIRKIDSIQSLSYPKDGYCGQICIAMLTGLTVDQVAAIMHSAAWQCSFSKLIETLDYFGIAHDEKITYTNGKEVPLPECCIVTIKRGQRSHFTLYYKGKYYDTATFDAHEIIGYLKIVVEL